MKSRMCKIELEAKCYLVPRALHMASAVKEDSFWKSWEHRVTNGLVGITLTVLIAQQQNNCVLTTQRPRARTAGWVKPVILHVLSKNPIKQLLSQCPSCPATHPVHSVLLSISLFVYVLFVWVT